MTTLPTILMVSPSDERAQQRIDKLKANPEIANAIARVENLKTLYNESVARRDHLKSQQSLYQWVEQERLETIGRDLDAAQKRLLYLVLKAEAR